MKKLISLSLAMLAVSIAPTFAQQETKPKTSKGVWQAHASAPRAAKDDTMIANTDKEPDLKEGFKPLFDQTGNDAEILGGIADFKFVDGILVATSLPKNSKNAFYCPKKNYDGNFILTFEWQWGNEVKGNSGVLIRSGFNKDGKMAGPQIEIEQDLTRGWNAGVYGEGAGGWKYSLSREDHAEQRAAVKDLYAWNRLTVEYKDGVIKTWSNGVPCANLKWDPAWDKARRGNDPDRNAIGLQVHVGKVGSVIKFKDIKIKELD